MDIWRAGAPSIDFLAPDVYFPNYSTWAARYAVPGNPLFIPEAKWAGDGTAAANAFYTFGRHDALGHSPFSIKDAPPNGPLADAYGTLAHLAPLILDHQGTDAMTGVCPPLAFDGALEQTEQSVSMGDYVFTVRFVDPWIPREEQSIPSHGGLIIQTSADEFIVAGSGITITFETQDPNNTRAGVARIEECTFADGHWKRDRVLNGDQSHQGRHLRIPPGGFEIQRLTLYRYR